MQNACIKAAWTRVEYARQFQTLPNLLSENRNFSKFPVPKLDKLPADIQERINDVTEKV